MKWEHKEEQVAAMVLHTLVARMVECANEQGSDGWELASSHVLGATGDWLGIMFLKRPLPEAP